MLCYIFSNCIVLFVYVILCMCIYLLIVDVISLFHFVLDTVCGGGLFFFFEVGGTCGTNGGEEEGVLVGKPEGKRLLGRPRRRWIDNIKMDLLEIRLLCCGLDWSGSG
jgi:hypothetical protein